MRGSLTTSLMVPVQEMSFATAIFPARAVVMIKTGCLTLWTHMASHQRCVRSSSELTRTDMRGTRRKIAGRKRYKISSRARIHLFPRIPKQIERVCKRLLLIVLTLDGKKALKTLLAANKRLNTAYLLKESFGQLWDYEREAWARRFFENWRSGLKWQRLKPYEKFAAMIERHWDGIAALPA